MGFFNLVEQNHRIGLASNGLGQPAAFFVTDIARRCADKPGDGMLLHKFTHIDSNHGRWIVKQKICQCLGKLGLAHARRPEKQKCPYRPVRIRKARSAPADRIAKRFNRFFLPDDPLSDCLFHLHQALPLAAQ